MISILAVILDWLEKSEAKVDADPTLKVAVVTFRGRVYRIARKDVAMYQFLLGMLYDMERRERIRGARCSTKNKGDTPKNTS